MTQQPEALRLADLLEQFEPVGNPVFVLEREAAAELRRLHEENERLKKSVTAMAMTHDKLRKAK